ncbi:MAG: DUF4405 domain-containing protein [Coriobacteriales bacterium]|jgi:hypothetical protein|nr:DUF4405 domain-containing protein [Coriobacteriales bacterium]
MRSNQRLVIDLVAAVVYLAAANPAFTGLLVHEWISLGIFFVLIVHVAVSFDSILTALKRRADRLGIANLVLDGALLVVFMVVTVSGIMVSRHILPLFGFVAPGYFFWNPVHAISAKLLLALLIVHVAAHFRWFVALLPKRAKPSDKERE